MSPSPSRRRREEPLDLSRPRSIHIIGVAGPGMAPLAVVLAGLGHRVSGSDVRRSPALDAVIAAGVTVTIGHDPGLVDDVEIVVHSTAIGDDNVELARAHAASKVVRHRSGALEALCRLQRCVAVAGTHGKSTTTALLTHMLVACGRDPSCIVGADVPGLAAGARSGGSDLLVVEADESDGTLEVLEIGNMVVTNVDVDHLDYFGTFEALQEAMGEVIDRVSGVVVMNADDPVSMAMAAGLDRATVRTFGRSMGADARVASIATVPAGLEVEVVVRGHVVRAAVPLRGEHNALNAAAALAMADVLGADIEQAAASLATFPGVQRRFTERGHFNGALLVDDYAHLPAEIEAAIAALRSHPEVAGRVVAVFQPNRYHRIAQMADSYAGCFHGADKVVITDIYASGTPVIEGVTGEMVWRAVAEAMPGADVVWAPRRADVVGAVAGYLEPGDGCISMGCGDIETFPDDLVGSGR